MPNLRVVVISDIHLSRERPFFFHNWDVAVDWIGAAAPDLVICCGDMALNAPASPSDLAFAIEQLRRLPCPVLKVPGNHDVGNNLPDVRGEHVFSPEYRSVYLAAAGEDRFVHSAANWTFVGINSLMLGSEDPAEHDQQVWLSRTLDAHEGQRIVLVTHKPLFLYRPDETELNQGCIYPASRGALLDLVRRYRVEMVISGHNHEYLNETREGVHMLWAPSTAFINDAGRPTRGGGLRKQGLIDMRFGEGPPSATLVTLDDIMTTDVGTWLTSGIAGYERNTSGRFRTP